MPYMQHLKVMVVDDTSVSRMLLVEGLNEIGIKNTVLAGDGEQALQSMMQAPCHIVFSDMNMPKLNGLQLLKALREYQPTRQCCFILVTGKGDRAMIEEGKKYGLNNFLAKPFTTATLRAAIETVVGKLV
ncbi:response regulator [Aestuariivirga sp.]|uniref:response regulator n=1 Tax=Aestuariivirga sp. TaxID=2650926 RepID=UPI0025BBA312|nr:response regulator [Aestuariivirga sp.]MCA3555388.1 response regulator [Aestuariivirga sp.]